MLQTQCRGPRSRIHAVNAVHCGDQKSYWTDRAHAQRTFCTQSFVCAPVQRSRHLRKSAQHVGHGWLLTCARVSILVIGNSLRRNRSDCSESMTFMREEALAVTDIAGVRRYQVACFTHVGSMIPQGTEWEVRCNPRSLPRHFFFFFLVYSDSVAYAIFTLVKKVMSAAHLFILRAPFLLWRIIASYQCRVAKKFDL